MIRTTADAEIRMLIEALSALPSARGEAAIARLTILGRRAVPRLIAAYHASHDRGRQLAVLRVLQASADGRALPLAGDALRAGGDVAVAGVALLRALLDDPGPDTHGRALDLLLAASEDASLERRARAASLDALAGARPDIRAALDPRLADLGTEGDATWDDAVEGRLPEAPTALMEAVDARAADAPLPCLLRVIQAIRAREDTGDPRRAEWQTVRGALHETAASRASRVALFDLRETLEATGGPLPSSFLSAAQMIGDPSCLEALATAYSRTADAGWQHRLATAFHALAARLRLTRRHAVMRRALAHAPGLSGAQ
jgi:hypothetical protein